MDTLNRTMLELKRVPVPCPFPQDRVPLNRTMLEFPLPVSSYVLRRYEGYAKYYASSPKAAASSVLNDAHEARTVTLKTNNAYYYVYKARDRM